MDFSFLISISDGDNQFIADFISTFEDTTIAQINQMKDAFDNGNLDEVKKLAHQIKPTGEMLAFESQPDILQLNNAPDTVSGDKLDRIAEESNEILKALKSEFSL
ncbi:MAG: hypothetical protein ABJG41_03375 [Cyclobacteriaceae bacterium]